VVQDRQPDGKDRPPRQRRDGERGKEQYRGVALDRAEAATHRCNGASACCDNAATAMPPDHHERHDGKGDRGSGEELRPQIVEPGAGCQEDRRHRCLAQDEPGKYPFGQAAERQAQGEDDRSGRDRGGHEAQQDHRRR
jgi:hypothetical protein